MYESRCTKEYYTTFVTKPTYNLFIVHCYAVVDLMMKRFEIGIECVCCWLLLNHHTLFTPLSSLLKDYLFEIGSVGVGSCYRLVY